MSISIDFDTKQLAKSKQLQLHYLPAKIVGDGEANVDAYFNNYTRIEREIGTATLSNALRGHALLGERINVPNGYKACVLQETSQPLSETANRQLRLTGTFDEMNYWNYDKVPSNGDGYRQALQAFDVAQALVEPVSEEALEAEILRRQIAKKENV